MIEATNFDNLGLVTFNRLERLAVERQSYLIDDFMLKPSINILAGDSGLGKSALAAQMAMCVAGGKKFFGHKVDEPGLVIYCDLEAQPATMFPMVKALAEHIGLDRVPDNFVLWNPNWNVLDKETIMTLYKTQLYGIVQRTKPKLVVIDTLRLFYPLAIKESEHATQMIKEMRKYSAQTGCSWLIIHHLRKKNKEERMNKSRPTVKHDIHLWMEEAAGSLGLINNTDLRLGWEKDGAVDRDAFWLGGFLRVFGEVGPFKVIRELDEDGEPVGYRLATPSEQLNQNEFEIYARLPDTNFTYKYLTQQLEKSPTTSSRFIRRALGLRLVEVVREIPSNRVGGRPQKVFAKNGDGL